MANQQPGQTKILQTTVTPNAGGALIQLQISDAPLDDEGANIRLTLFVQLPAYDTPLFAHLQRVAMKIASRAIVELEREVYT